MESYEYNAVINSQDWAARGYLIRFDRIWGSKALSEYFPDWQFSGQSYPDLTAALAVRDELYAASQAHHFQIYNIRVTDIRGFPIPGTNKNAVFNILNADRTVPSGYPIKAYPQDVPLAFAQQYEAEIISRYSKNCTQLSNDGGLTYSELYCAIKNIPYQHIVEADFLVLRELITWVNNNFPAS